MRVIDLETPKQVMQAFLSGEKLQNDIYKDDCGDIYLYMDENGFICEEDGAGAKSDRCPITMRNDTKWRIIKPQSPTPEGEKEGK